MDIRTLDTVKAANEGAECEILHPTTGAPLGIKIKVHGTDSEAYAKAQRAQADARIEKSARGRRGVRRGASVSLAEIEDSQIALLVACTIGWTGIELDGAPLPFSPENAGKVYREFPWIREQIDGFIGDRAHFTPG